MSNSPVNRPWTNVCALLDPKFGIAPDVTFQIVTTEGGQYGEVKAHRLILGFLSPVFRTQFYGFGNDTDDVIPVKGTSKKAFETLIDFIYGKNINWEVMSLSELFDVVNLAEMYILPEFMEEIKNQIDNFHITEENLIEAAAMAEAFDHFKEASGALMTSCQKFLNTNTKTVQDAKKFASKNVSTKFEGLALRLLASLEPLDVECSNCGGSTCSDGMFVTDFQTLKVGCVLKTSDGLRNKYCKVAYLNMLMEKFSVRWEERGTYPDFGRGIHGLYNMNGWMWKYACTNT